MTLKKTNNQQQNFTPDNVKIEARHPHFDVEQDLAELWANGDVFRTVFLNALSILFPEGERFFIQSVRKFQDQITDPVLKEKVKLFVEQEGQHTREHKKYNNALAQRGYDIEKLEAPVKRNIKLIKAVADDKRQLAITCAVEHITASLANAMLQNPQWFDDASPKMRALWQWHAIEEIEHKSVAYDVFQATVNNQRIRRVAYTIACMRLTMTTFMTMCRMFKTEGKLFDLKMWWGGLKFWWGKDGLVRYALPSLLDYYRKDFHPWDEDNSQLINEWKDYLPEAG